MSELTLLLNAAEQRVQFGVVQDGLLLSGQDWAAAAQGAELLTPALTDALKRLGLKPSAITRVACVAGPGSFTGLRLALTTASALHQSLGIPVAALNYLELLAEGCPCPSGSIIRATVYARRDVLCVQDFIRQAEGLVSLSAAQAVHPARLDPSDLVEQFSVAPIYMIGSGLTRNLAALPAMPARVISLPILCDHPSWDAFVRLAQAAQYLHTDPAPNYLRDSEAEDNLESLAARRGDAPAAARIALQQLLSAPPVSEM